MTGDGQEGSGGGGEMFEDGEVLGDGGERKGTTGW